MDFVQSGIIFDSCNKFINEIKQLNRKNRNTKKLVLISEKMHEYTYLDKAVIFKKCFGLHLFKLCCIYFKSWPWGKVFWTLYEMKWKARALLFGCEFLYAHALLILDLTYIRAENSMTWGDFRASLDKGFRWGFSTRWKVNKLLNKISRVIYSIPR